MESLYSKIIWDELKKPDFEIHKAEPGEIDKLILDWVKTADLNRVEEVLLDLSWINRFSVETYYDGPFFGLSQRDEKELRKIQGTYKCDLLVHDMGMVPTFLAVALKTQMNPSEIRLIADILEAFWERMPKETSTCSIGQKPLHEVWGYKMLPPLADEEEIQNERISLNMKHEKFKSFLLSNTEGIEKFLNGPITPKSISIPHSTVVIGYVDAEKDHHYKLVTHDLALVKNHEELDERLEVLAASHEGVVCQDVHLGENKETRVTFLVAVKK